MAKKYLFRIDSKLKLLPASKIAGLTYGDMIMLTAAAIEEQRNQLVIDAHNKTDKVFYGRKVVEALEDSISKLEERLPNLREQAHRLVYGELSLN